MKTFSRLRLFTLVCLGIPLMFLGSIADVNAQISTLEITGESNIDREYEVGDPVKAEFVAQTGGKFASGVKLNITTSGLKEVVVSNGGVTDAAGIVEVTAKASETALRLPGSLAVISATWPTERKDAEQKFKVVDVGKSPALIIVNSPNPKSELKINDTFTQMISIENRGKYSTLPLSAWQMDIKFNPLILEVFDVTEGDFLESDGVDAVYAEMIGPGRISVSQARAGQMTNPSPPPPNVAKAPSPAGISLAPGEKGELLTITFKVLAVAEEALGLHNVRLQSDQDDDEDGTLDRISYSILVSDVIVTTHQSSAKEDVNQDGMVNILDLVVVAGSIGAVPPNPRADVNSDGFVNVLDLITIYESPHWAKPVSSKRVSAANEPALTAPPVSRRLDSATIQSWINLAQVEDDGSAIFDLGIANLEVLLASRIPTETRLLLNYPNPFNPETWIPYQLAEATDVTVTIHSMNGSLIRTLALGHQAAGVYQSKSQAAYWDGRNELGEHVASGLYFYTLTAGKFSATGKMLVRK